MALNDWADRAHDARTRPERPVPAREIAPGAAFGLAAVLLCSGPVLAWSAAPAAGVVLGGVAALAALYDLAGRGPWIGPLLLALCRAGNLAAGFVLASALAGRDPLAFPPVLAIPALYGAYVFVVSRLGRLEDAEDARPLGRRPARHLAVAAGLLLACPIMPLVPARDAFEPSLRITLASLVAAAGAFGVLRMAFRDQVWTRVLVLRSMGMALRRLLVFTATVAVLCGTPTGLVVGVAILGGYPLSYALRRAFPPS